MVEHPGRGCRVCMYLWYQVINNTGEPRTFIPYFELVTHDKNTIHFDGIFPRAQDMISWREDPQGYYRIKNSVTISADPIPPAKPDAVERAVTGVAIWDDVPGDTNNFSIFVTGLSNGAARTDPIVAGGEGFLPAQDAELDFRKLGDQYLQESREIQFLPPPKWIYRAFGGRELPR